MTAAPFERARRAIQRLAWAWRTRNCDCHWYEPYGAVVMAGCPLHD